MRKIAFALTSLLACSAAFAADQSIEVPMNAVTPDGVGASVGTITVTQSKYGLVFTPKLEGLAPGVHGFHLHVNPSCDPGEKDGKKGAALAAGGHFDPARTNRHDGPYVDTGHLGDLPAITVTADGKSTTDVLAPRLKTLAELKGHSLMVHAGGDNHSDHPEALGGGGARIVCGVIR
ncbi:Cu-Zn family superoxide dismutase [Luteibacter sp. Sphag1AF]|uniref:superoxide dismutase family protein n=1 Tax=Luteibacter sp. Sphag1AF TaxID=2587031 RepID=UPI001622A211|nr:superoxide dismutase family protein [Luteibacter sp. Sphag1AF]MBB3228320.1 Cu-Zn family superoxide dismutase [Luteibacter sp. Sphag1AF]